MRARSNHLRAIRSIWINRMRPKGFFTKKSKKIFSMLNQPFWHRFLRLLLSLVGRKKTSNAAKKIETRILRTPYFIDISRND